MGDPTKAPSVEERPGDGQEKAVRDDTPSAAQAHSVGLLAVAASRCAGRREHGAAFGAPSTDRGDMSNVEVSGESAAATAPVNAGEFKLEVVVLPVSDVDRAKEFYGSLGWRLDADVARGEDLRLVQFTPPGSGCSIQFGTNIASGAPGSVRACTWPSPTSKLRVASCSIAAWRWARCSTRGRWAIASTTPAVCPGRRPTAVPMARSPRSATRTATAGCSRRSRRACRVAERRS